MIIATLIMHLLDLVLETKIHDLDFEFDYLILSDQGLQMVGDTTEVVGEQLQRLTFIYSNNLQQ